MTYSGSASMVMEIYKFMCSTVFLHNKNSIAEAYLSPISIVSLATVFPTSKASCDTWANERPLTHHIFLLVPCGLMFS